LTIISCDNCCLNNAGNFPDSGTLESWMKNQNGVVIDLFTTTQGRNLILALSGVKLMIKK
jgi:hypothetical protein